MSDTIDPNYSTSAAYYRAMLETFLSNVESFADDPAWIRTLCKSQREALPPMVLAPDPAEPA